MVGQDSGGASYLWRGTLTITILAHPRDVSRISANHTYAREDLPRIVSLNIGDICLIFREEQAEVLRQIGECASRAYSLLTAPETGQLFRGVEWRPAPDAQQRLDESRLDRADG